MSKHIRQIRRNKISFHEQTDLDRFRGKVISNSSQQARTPLTYTKEKRKISELTLSGLHQGSERGFEYNLHLSGKLKLRFSVLFIFSKLDKSKTIYYANNVNDSQKKKVSKLEF